MNPEQAAWLVTVLLGVIIASCLTGAAEWLARRYPAFDDWVERMIERIAR